MRQLPMILSLFFMVAGSTSAHEGRILDLKQAPPDHQIGVIGYCNGRYEVKLKDGSTRQFREFDLRFKTDSSPNGPKPGTPTLIRAGMMGDRAFVVFSGFEEMKEFIKKVC